MNKKQLPNYAHREYTQESVFLTDIHLMAVLLSASYEKVGQKPMVEVENALQTAVTNQEASIKSRFDVTNVEEKFVKQYKGQYLKQFEDVFGKKIPISDIKLERELQAFYATQPPLSLSNKDDLVSVVNQAFIALGISETVDEEVAYTLVQHSSLGTMYPQWEAMVRFMEE